VLCAGRWRTLHASPLAHACRADLAACGERRDRAFQSGEFIRVAAAVIVQLRVAWARLARLGGLVRAAALERAQLAHDRRLLLAEESRLLLARERA
jgi:hypothetical protein